MPATHSYLKQYNISYSFWFYRYDDQHPSMAA